MQIIKKLKIPEFLMIMCLLLSGMAVHSQSFEEGLETIKTDHNLIGLAVGVRCGGSEMGTYYGGVANIENDSPIDENTSYRVASISKSFTAAGLMILLDLGLFNLDDDISTALGYSVRNPDFPDVPITYRMLLSHQSSLQDGSGYSPFLSATYAADPIPSIQEVLLPDGDFYTTNIWRTETPGTHFAYSNLNYGLIGTLIESLSGVRFDIFMKENLLEPLNIQGGYNTSELEEIQNLAVLYRDNIPQSDDFNGENPAPIVTETYTPGTNGSLFAPQGGLRCTLEDLLDFATMLTNGGTFDGNQILSPEAVQEMSDMQWDFNGSNGDNYFGLFNRWGLGLHHSGANGVLDKVVSNEVLLGHPGEAYGLISDLYFHPETGYTIAFITNGYSTGGGYAFGEESIYYLPEEETFALAESLFWEACSTLDVTSISKGQECKGVYYDTNSGSLIIPENLQGFQVEVFNLTGQKVKEQATAGRNIPFETHSGNMSIVHLTNGNQSCSLKIMTGR
ncbi:MAG TPA: serine hydrolase domain-containing protein [Cryomorphaceae bacterium]|nr:serine hydrolase domain-containing protein [Cryomorphaceae bacterium]